MIKSNIKRKNIFFLLFLLLIMGKLLSQEVVLERTLPPGWIYKEFYASPSGLKALFLIQDLPDEIRATGKVAGRLQVFDSGNNLVADLTLPEWHWFEDFIGNDRILINVGDENGNWEVKVIDLNGHEIYSIEAGGRWTQKAVIGNDFALTPRLGWESGPISIIDGEKGIEKLKIGPYPKGPDGMILPSCFLLIGDGYYITGLGATLFLENYSGPGEKIWMIKDVGGNIEAARILSRDLVAIGYEEKRDFKNEEFVSGLAIIEWNTGKIVFKKSAKQIKGIRDFWYPIIKYLNLDLEEDGSLLFYGDDEAVKLPKEKTGRWEWNEGKAVKLKMDPAQKSDSGHGDRKVRVEVERKYVIKDFGTFIRVEKRHWLST